MTTFTGTAGNDTANANTGTLTGFTGGTLAELQDATGDIIDGAGGNDTIVGGGGNDQITGGTGLDTMSGGEGDDTFFFKAGEASAGESIDGGGGTDTISLAIDLDIDLSSTSLANIENIVSGTGAENVTLTADQFLALSSINMGAGTDTLNVRATGVYDFTPAAALPARFGADDIWLRGSGGNDNVTMTLAQWQTFDFFDLGVGTNDILTIKTDANLSINFSTLFFNIESIVIDDDDSGHTLTGSPLADTINGNGGKDVIDGAAGNDTITAGSGNDVVKAGSGDDTIVGGEGTGDDVYDGGANIDTVVYSSATNSVTVDLTAKDRSGEAVLGADGAGPNPDTIGALLVAAAAGYVATTAVGKAEGADIGTDALIGIENVIGGQGDDTITGDGAANALSGGAGADIITGGAGKDTLTGGLGADTFVIAAADLAAGETIDGTAEINTIDTLRLDAAGTYDLSTFTTITNIDNIALNQNAAGFNLKISNSQVSTANSEQFGPNGNLRIDSSITISSAVVIDATAVTGSNRLIVWGAGFDGGDTINGGAGKDDLLAGAGTDTVNGGAGDDHITGGAGADNLTGGLGTDFFAIGVGDLAAGESIDGTAEKDSLDTLGFVGGGTYDLSTFTTISNIDQITLQDAPGYDLTVADSQVSTADANQDGVGGDLVVTTEIFASNGVTISGAGLTGLNRITVTGTDQSDTLTGGAGADVLAGGAGADTIAGGAGADSITGGGGKDTLTGGLGGDTFVVSAVADLAAGEIIDGTSEKTSTDTLRLDGAGIYDLSTFSTITNVDVIAFNKDATGFEVTLANSQVSTADWNGDGTGGDIRIASLVAMTKGVYVGGLNLSSGNRILVDGTNLGGGDTVSTGAGDDVVNTGAGNDTIWMVLGGADSLTGGTGGDLFAISGGLGSTDTLDGTAEAATTDLIRFYTAGSYDFSTLSVVNIDRIEFADQPGGSTLILSDALVSTADWNKDGIQGDLSIRAYEQTLGITIDGSGLTGVNRIVVEGADLGGGDTVTGGAGNDILATGAGADTITAGAGNDVVDAGAGDDTIVGGSGAGDDVYDGGADTDTLILSSATDAVTVDLTAKDRSGETPLGADGGGPLPDTIGALLAVAGKSPTLAVGKAEGVDIGTDALIGIENVTGGKGNDSITGDAAANVLVGGAGNDTLDGGDGSDTAVYSGAWVDYTITAGSVADNRGGSPDGTDTVSNIENFKFSNGTFTAAEILNLAPTDIDLSHAAVGEATANDTVVGALTRTDANAALGDTASYTLLDDAGGRFKISGTDLVVADGSLLNQSVDASHDVKVRVTDAHGLFFDEVFKITVTDVNAFAVTTPADTDATANTVNEGAAAGTTVGVTASASDGDPTDAVSYSLDDSAGGAFQITAGGVVKVLDGSKIDHEANGTLNVVVRATSTDGSFDTMSFAITVNDLNDEAPVFTSLASATVAENTSTATVVYDADVTDADDTLAFRTIVYSLAGADATLFDINAATGAVTFKASANFEAAADAGKNNVYDITVKADDGVHAPTKAVTITVTNENDNAPVITSNGGGATVTIAVVENTKAVTTVVATDADGGAAPAYSIVGGADADMFSMTGGALAFKANADFDTLADANHDNLYEVIVQASDGTLSDTQAITVSLTNVRGLTLVGGSGNETIDGTHPVGKLFPTGEEDILSGKAGNDKLSGLGGNDRLNGGLGLDTLTGGAGKDRFELTTNPSAKNNYDTITDFNVADDAFRIDRGVYDKLGKVGVLDAAKFFIGANAHLKTDRMIYDDTTGNVFYDEDGSAKAFTQVKVAVLSAGLALSNLDFVLFDA